MNSLKSTLKSAPEAADRIAQPIHTLHILIEISIRTLTHFAEGADAHHLSHRIVTNALKFFIRRQSLDLIEATVGRLIESTDALMFRDTSLLQNWGRYFETSSYRCSIGAGDKRSPSLSQSMNGL